MGSGVIATRIREEESTGRDIRVFENSEELAIQSAALFSEHAQQAIAERGAFFVLLSGGHTPVGMFSRMTKLSLPWDKIHWFWGDDRMVPPDNPESNYLNFRTHFLDHVRVPEENVHRVRTEAGSPEKVAELYQTEIQKYFRGSDWPRFDFAIQGMGNDGHTASLFPGSQTEHDSPRWVIAPFVEKLGVFRISVTLGVLNSTRAVLFLVTGEDKAERVRQVLRDPREHQGLLPSQRVQPLDGQLFWFLDQAAASRL
jgi:6-phosphogluconolactonase